MAMFGEQRGGGGSLRAPAVVRTMMMSNSKVFAIFLPVTIVDYSKSAYYFEIFMTCLLSASWAVLTSAARTRFYG